MLVRVNSFAVWFHLFQISRIGKTTETEGREEVARVRRGRNGYRLSLEGKGNILELTKDSNVLNSTEQSLLKQLSAYNLSFTSVLRSCKRMKGFPKTGYGWSILCTHRSLVMCQALGSMLPPPWSSQCLVGPFEQDGLVYLPTTHMNISHPRAARAFSHPKLPSEWPPTGPGAAE